MASHKEIAEKFATRQPNKRHQGQVVWNGSRVYCTGDIIFSYGSHFPMAKYLGDRDKKPFFIKNSDKYSSSTSTHQGCVRQYCPGPSVSRSRLSKIIHFEDIEMEHLYLWREGIVQHLWHDTETGVFYDDTDYRTLEPNDPDPSEPFMSIDGEPDVNDPNKSFKVVNLRRHVLAFVKPYKPSRYGEFKVYRKQESKRFQQGVFTVSQVVVLKVKDKYLLCTDGVIAELAGQPKTIAQALKMKKAV